MKTFIIPVSFQFNGTIEVQAESLEDAKRDIEKYMHATINIQDDQNNLPTDYNIPMKGDLVFLPINMDTLNLPS